MKNIKNILIGVLVVGSPFTFAQAHEDDDYAHLFSEKLSGPYAQKIIQVAGSSSCRSYNWKNRGRAPAGYIKGVALGFARSLCRLRTNTSNRAAQVMSQADTGNASKDALTHYRSVFSNLQIKINVAGADTMRALYALGVGLGMRESSGAYCEGWDTSAGSNRPASSGEAGLFQVSYDSIGASPELRKLYDEYLANPDRCLLDVFKEGASCRAQKVLGKGAGADFQAFNKVCPAFAAEYTMTLLRVLRGHFGPINRREAEVKTICNDMLKNVQALVVADPVNACRELF